MSKLEDVGELGLVGMLVSMTGAHAPAGPGDDAAVVDLASSRMAISTDVVTAEGHMPPGMTWYDLGWMAVAVNLSDVAAMGASASGVLLAMCAPRDMDVEDLRDAMSGAVECARRFGVPIVGGDTKESPSALITGTAFGELTDGPLMRDGCAPGDLLAVTGELGGAAVGFESVHGRGLSPGCEARLLRPEPRVEEGRSLGSSGCVTACMDVSDGLSRCVHSMGGPGTTFEVDWERIPMPREVRSLDDPQWAVLSFGGDYELLFTFPPGSDPGVECTVIGRVVEGDRPLLIRHGERTLMEDTGHEHFR